jgi:hypothetical protein
MQVVDYIIIIIFLLSFIMKSTNILDLKYEILSYRIVPKKLISIAAYCLLFIEFSIALLYSFPKFFILKTVLSGCVILLFTFATVYKRKRDGMTSCRCFGDITWFNKYPLSRNIIISSLILFDLFLHTQYDFQTPMMAFLVIFLAVCFIKFLLAKKENRTIKQVLEHVNGSQLEIIVIPYTTHHFEKIDKLLSIRRDNRYLIIFFSPSWLFRLKKRKWESHNVIDGNEDNRFMPLNNNESYVLLKRHNKITKINYVLEYLDNEPEL